MPKCPVCKHPDGDLTDQGVVRGIHVFRCRNHDCRALLEKRVTFVRLRDKTVLGAMVR